MEKNPTVVFTGPRCVEIEMKEKLAPKADELLIKTKCSMISTGTELSVLEAEYEEGSLWESFTEFPCYPGYCNIGEVIAVGENVDKDWIGQRVASAGPHALYHTSSINNQTNFKVNIINRDISDEQAVFFTIASIVMNSIRRANVRWGDAVVIYGAGLLGQLAAQFCRLCGAKPVIVVDISDNRLERLPEDPSIIPVNSKNEDVVSIVKKVTKGRMADIVFEVTGIGSLIPQEFSVLRKQGMFVVLSAPRGKTVFDFHDLCCFKSFTIIGTHNSSHPSAETLDNPWTAERDAELFFDLIADGELHLDNLVSNQESYTKAPDLYQMLMKDRSNAMGCIIKW